MSKTYKSYDEDYKKTIVKLYESGKGISDLSREYDVGKSVISSWIKKYNMQESIPYESAKPMYLVDNVDNQEVLKDIILDTCKDLKK